MNVRVLFFGNSQSNFSNGLFKALLDTPCELVGVVDSPAEKRISTNPEEDGNPSFVRLARSLGTASFEPSSPNLQEFLNRAGELTPDLILCIGYPCILKNDLLSIPRLGAVNFHASLLPKYRGKHPVFWALRNGERWTGLTVHKMDAGIDTGSILYQVRVKTRKEDSVETLYQRIIQRSRGLVEKLISDLGQGAITGRLQTQEAGYYSSSIKESDFRLDWTRPAETLRRWIYTTPGKCYADIAGQRFYVESAQVVSIPPNQRKPGRILNLGKTSGIVAAGMDGLRFSRLRTASGKPTSFARLCASHGLVEGDILTVLPT